MEVTINEVGGQNYVTIAGRLDTSNADEFGNQLLQLFKTSNGDIIIDCSNLLYISSAGLRQFLILLKAAKAAGRRMVLKHLGKGLKEVFDITGFSAIFCIEP